MKHKLQFIYIYKKWLWVIVGETPFAFPIVMKILDNWKFWDGWTI
jgi:hypothetical protein